MNIDMVNAEIQRELSKIINYDLKDPRVKGIVTVLRVDTTVDLKHCKVNISIMGEVDETDATFDAILRAKGYIRKELARRLRIRQVPELNFVKDDSIEHSIRISKILNDINNDKNDNEDNDPFNNDKNNG